VKILLTATVTPQVLEDLHIRDPAERRRQYRESLRRWIPIAAKHSAMLVLVENSGEDLARLAHGALGEVPDLLRLVQAPAPSPHDVDRGKGAAEAAMMDLFCDQFLDDPTETWYKVTGRLFVKNFSRCIPELLPPNSAVARVAMNFRQMDTRFFGASAGLWKEHFTGAGVHVRDRDDIFIEKILMRRMLAAMADGAQLLRFDAQPAFAGRSGTHADRVYDSLSSRVKRLGTGPLERLLKGPLSGKQY
jgi:hypothetical protein